MIDILKNNKNFLFFWLGQTISQFGDRIHTLAVIWLIYSWYNSGIIVGVVLIAATLPSFLLSPIAGNILDRYDRRKIMIICDIIRMLSVFVLSVLAFLNMINLTIIILITVIISIGSAFFNPATLAVIPSIVEEKQLLKANAFYQISASTSAAMGFIAGSGLISLIGVPIAFFVNAFSFLFSAYFLYKLNYKHIAFQSSTSFLEDFKEGWKASQQIPLIKHLFIPIIIINFFLAAFSILIPFLGEGIFNKGSAGVGSLMSALTFGMLIGAVLISTLKLKIKIVLLLFPSLFSVGIIFFLMYIYESFPFYIISFLLIGLFINLTNINLISLLQKIIPRNISGKVFGLLTSASVSAQPISYGIMGFLVDILKPEGIILICFVAFIIISFIFLNIKELKVETLN